MVKIFLSFILFLLIQFNAFAQMASSSLFSEMKSLNPAVINGRPYGQTSLFLGKDSIKKYQLIYETVNASGVTQKEESNISIDVDSKSFFYGGKGGGLFTTEFLVIKNGGTRKAVDTFPGLPDTVISNNVTFSHLEASVGISNYFGLSFAKQAYNFASKFSFTTNSIDFTEDKKTDISATIIKAGVAFPYSIYRFATYLESASSKVNIDQYTILDGISKTSTTKKSKTLGAGLGLLTDSLHLEMGYEKILSSDSVKGSPVRISGTAELKFWKFAFGYTALSYQNGFQDNNKVVYNELVFPNAPVINRLDNIINFSYGSSGGFALGGTVSISKVTSKEYSPFVNEKWGKLDTETNTKVFTAKVGYAW
jgi:hypothetical protein